MPVVTASRCGLNVDRPKADLEAGWVDSPRGFESRILRRPQTESDLRKRALDLDWRGPRQRE